MTSDSPDPIRLPPDSGVCGASDPGVCCLPGAWDRWNPMLREPLDSRVIDAAAAAGVNPHLLDWLVEAEWGWEPHNEGYAEAVLRGVKALGG